MNTWDCAAKRERGGGGGQPQFAQIAGCRTEFSPWVDRDCRDLCADAMLGFTQCESAKSTGTHRMVVSRSTHHCFAPMSTGKRGEGEREGVEGDRTGKVLFGCRRLVAVCCAPP